MGAGSIEEVDGIEEVTVRKMTISQSSKAAQEWTGFGVSLRRGAAARSRQRSGFGGLIRGVGAGMLAAVGVLALAAPAWAQSCADCHSGIGPASHTAHAAVACDSCHLNHEEFPHPAEASNVACAVCHSPEADQTALGVHAQHQPETEAADCTVCHGTAHDVALPGTTPFRRAMVETCGMCHSEELEQFQQSVHGKLLNTVGGREAPNCTTCHDEHAIRHPSDPKARTHGSHIRETCSACHGDLALTSRFGMAGNRVLSFDASYHGLAARAGSQTVANCGSCHGYHDILPSTDPRSRIYPANLSKTCGSCHPGAGSQLARGQIHFVEGEGTVPIADLVAEVYRWVLIPLVIGLMLLHNLGDWLRKARQRLKTGALGAGGPRMELRMLPLERLQHALLVVSFVVLAWTGFALKFPDEFWAYPLVVWERAWPVRGYVHRGAAIVFVISGLLHVATLCFSTRLREHWKHLWPRWSDVTGAAAGFRYNLGLSHRPPRLPAHSYIEKAEYWAVVWGAVLMTLTGVVLWANNFFLALFPKAFFDISTVVHYYEALLAVLAIVVWHFYFVILDPSVYPMSAAWLTGWGPARSPEPESGSAIESEAPVEKEPVLAAATQPTEASSASESLQG